MRDMQAEAGAPLTAHDPDHGEPDPSHSGDAGALAYPDRGSRRRLLGLLSVVAALTYAADQASKLWAVASLSDGQVQPILGDTLRLVLIRNAGAALSIGNGSTWLMTAIAVVICGFVISACRRVGSTGWALALGLILGGALGNLTDRMLRAPGPGQGHVVDFIAYGSLFIGNVADIAIVGAGALIVLLTLRGVPLQGRPTP